VVAGNGSDVRRGTMHREVDCVTTNVRFLCVYIYKSIIYTCIVCIYMNNLYYILY